MVKIVHSPPGTYSSTTIHSQFPLKLASAIVQNYHPSSLDFQPGRPSNIGQGRGCSLVLYDDLDTEGLRLLFDSLLQSVWNGRYYDPLATLSWNVRRYAVDLKGVAEEVGVPRLAALANGCLARLDSQEQTDAALTVGGRNRADSA